MKRVVKRDDGRPKAFLGAIIGAVAGAVGGAISASKTKKSEELAFKQAQAEQNRVDTLSQANAMTNQYSNQNYVDQYQNKITLKGGGTVKIKKTDNSDRMVNAKKLNLAGRGKKTNNAEIARPQAGFGSFLSGLGSALPGVGSLIGAIGQKVEAPKVVKKADGFNYGAPKIGLTPNSYSTDTNMTVGNPAQPQLDTNGNPINPNGIGVSSYMNRVQQAKFGAKKQVKQVGKSK